MKRKRDTPEQIITRLREADGMPGAGRPGSVPFSQAIVQRGRSGVKRADRGRREQRVESSEEEGEGDRPKADLQSSPLPVQCRPSF